MDWEPAEASGQAGGGRGARVVPGFVYWTPSAALQTWGFAILS